MMAEQRFNPLLAVRPGDTAFEQDFEDYKENRAVMRNWMRYMEFDLNYSEKDSSFSYISFCYRACEPDGVFASLEVRGIK